MRFGAALVLVAIIVISASVMAIWGRHRLRAQWEADQQAQWLCEVATALRKEYDHEFEIWSSLEEDLLLRRLWERELEVVRWPQLEVWVGVLDDDRPRLNFAPPRDQYHSNHFSPNLAASNLVSSNLAKSDDHRIPGQTHRQPTQVEAEKDAATSEVFRGPAPTPWTPLPIGDFGRRLRLWSQNLTTSFPCPTWGVPLWLSAFKARWSVDRDALRGPEREVPKLASLQGPDLKHLHSQRELLEKTYREDVESYCRVDHSVARARERVRLIQERCAVRDPASKPLVKIQGSERRPDRCGLAQARALTTKRELENQRIESERKFFEKWQVWRMKTPPTCATAS